MPLDKEDLSELTQYAMSFRTYTDHDPFQAFLDRTMLTGDPMTKDLSELSPTIDEAWAMLNALQAMTHRLHPSTYEWYLDMQALLLAVISQDGPLEPMSRISASRAAITAREHQLRTDVNDAREAGNSWAAIGRVFGVTRQSAFERFGQA